MKPIFRIGLILVFLAGICGWPALKSQDNLMSDAARKFWLQNNPQHSGNGEFKFDRISRHGDLFIYERYCPASFVILMRSKEEIIPAGYSFQNLFYDSVRVLKSGTPAFFASAFIAAFATYGS